VAASRSDDGEKSRLVTPSGGGCDTSKSALGGGAAALPNMLIQID
jgi:hypothetical protein